MQHQNHHVIKGSLLVAGTAIGGGMLALPVLTARAGFIPSVFVYFLCWIFMAGTGLLFLEICQWMKKEANIISMAEATLGKGGKICAWLLYLFLFYCLTIAYIVGCGDLFVLFSGSKVPDWLGSIFFVLLFSPLVMTSTSVASRINVFFVAGLGLSYIAFVWIGYHYVDTQLLQHADWSHSFRVLPIAFTSFAYQGMIPTLCSYMEYKVEDIRKSILIGSFIPLFAYVIWQWLILGIIPIEGEHGLTQVLNEGGNAVSSLKYFIQNPYVYLMGQSFAFFALITSFLGVTLGLRDFLSDGLKIKNEGKGKLFLFLLIFAFPLVIAVYYPNVFLLALDYAGGFGCALLLGLFPILMAWKGRYSLKFLKNPQLPGGKTTLILFGLFVLIELLSEFRQLF